MIAGPWRVGELAEQGFEFLEPGQLIDGDLELKLMGTDPGDATKGIVTRYRFAMRQKGDATDIGGIVLRVELTPKLAQFGGHIGYGVYEPLRAHRYIVQSIRLRSPLARRHRLNPLLITCGEDNVASRRTCELAGGKLKSIRAVDAEPGKIRRTCYCEITL